MPMGHVGCFRCGKCITCQWCICERVKASVAHPPVVEPVSESEWRPYEQYKREDKDGSCLR